VIKGLEMKRIRVTPFPCAVDQYLRLGKISFRPVHSQSEGGSLVVVRSEFLTAKVASICRRSFSVSSAGLQRDISLALFRYCNAGTIRAMADRRAFLRLTWVFWGWLAY